MRAGELGFDGKTLIHQTRSSMLRSVLADADEVAEARR
jgi:hypothetical protein